MPTRTIAYLRASTDKQADRGVSLYDIEQGVGVAKDVTAIYRS
jgi:hypothetical protein